MPSPLLKRNPFPANFSFKAATNFSLIFSLYGENSSLVTTTTLGENNLLFYSQTHSIWANVVYNQADNTSF